MPPHDGVRLHKDQRRAPVLPEASQRDPKQSVSRPDMGAFGGALQVRQLLPQRQVFKRDGSVSTTEQPEHSEQHHKRG